MYGKLRRACAISNPCLFFIQQIHWRYPVLFSTNHKGGSKAIYKYARPQGVDWTVHIAALQYYLYNIE